MSKATLSNQNFLVKKHTNYITRNDYSDMSLWEYDLKSGLLSKTIEKARSIDMSSLFSSLTLSVCTQGGTATQKRP